MPHDNTKKRNVPVIEKKKNDEHKKAVQVPRPEVKDPPIVQVAEHERGHLTPQPSIPTDSMSALPADDPMIPPDILPLGPSDPSPVDEEQRQWAEKMQSMAAHSPTGPTRPPDVTPKTKRELLEERANAPKPTESQDSRWKSAGKGALAGLAEAFDFKYGIPRNWQEFAARLGPALGKSIAYGVKPELDEQVAWRDDALQARAELGELNTEEQRVLDLETRRVQNENIQVDNERQRDNLSRLERGDIERAEDKEVGRKLQLRNQLVRQLLDQGFYKKGANPEFDQQLDSLGIQVVDYDQRKRDTREVNGKLQERNPDTGEWQDSTGADIDPEKVPMEVRFKNGAVISVTPKTYFTAMVQYDLTGQRLAQQNSQFQQSEANRYRNLDHSTKMRLYGQAIDRFTEINGRQPTEAEIKQLRDLFF